MDENIDLIDPIGSFIEEPPEPVTVDPIPEPDPLKPLVIFYIATGEIRGLIIGQTLDFALAHNCPEGADILEVSDADVNYRDMYVVDGEIIPRPVFSLLADKTTIAADGVEVLLVSGYPPNSTISIVGPISEEWVEQEQDVGITVNIPGEYVVSAAKFPYLSQKVIFNAS